MNILLLNAGSSSLKGVLMESVTMGGVDALGFTAGVGEKAVEVRQIICSGLQCLGLELDAHENTACRPDADLATQGSPGRIYIIATREDVKMLKEVLQIIGDN